MTTFFVVKGASVFNDQGEFEDGLDVAVRDGTITEVGANISPTADDAIIDAFGNWLMPGVFDFTPIRRCGRATHSNCSALRSQSGPLQLLRHSAERCRRASPSFVTPAEQTLD